MMVERLEMDFDEENDEDTIFVSLADLFSLLSLTIIYVVLTFGQTTFNSTEPVVSATLEGSGPGKPIDPAAVYVSLERRENSVVFLVIQNGVATERAVPASGSQSTVPESWLKNAISRMQHGTIYLYLGPKEQDLVVKALFVDAQRFLGSVFPNVQVATL
jgi:hypothetical protein